MNKESSRPIDCVEASFQPLTESKNREVYSYENIVLKRLKSSITANNSQLQQIEQTVNYKRRYEIGLKAIERSGGTEQNFPASHPILHDLNGETSITRIQKKVEGNRLADLPFSEINNQTGNDLSVILIANLKLVSKGLSLDLSGTSGSDENIVNKFKRRLFPLHYSNNIIVDNESRAVLIDDEVFPCRNKSEALMMTINAAGSLLGLCYLHMKKKI